MNKQQKREHAIEMFTRFYDGEDIASRQFPPSGDIIKYFENCYVPEPKKIGVPDGFWDVCKADGLALCGDKAIVAFLGLDGETPSFYRGYWCPDYKSLYVHDIFDFDIEGVDPATSWTPRPEKDDG